MGIKHTKVAGGVDNPAYDVSKGEWNDDHDISTLDIVDLSTAETDGSLVMAPDGAGGVEFRAEAGGGGGAPTTADYLVGTANGSLSAEIVVGTTPGGELGGTWASPTVDATHSGSAHHDAVTVGTGLDVTGQLVELDLSEVAAGGELGGFMDAPTVDSTHSGSTHAGAAAAAVTTHEGLSDPHPGYLTAAEGNAAYQPLDADLTAIAALTTTAAGLALLDDADAAAQRTTLGLGTLATQSGTFSGTSSGTNTGDQTVPAFATPAVVLGTAAAAGAASTVIRSDSTIVAFDATTPAAVGTAATGSQAVAARRDHVHATGAGTPSTQAFGDAAATGSGPAAAMTDHKHAMPANPLGLGRKVIYKTADESVVNNTLQDDDHLTFAIAASEVWVITCYLWATNAVSTADIKVLFTVPASAVVRWGMIGTGLSATAADGNARIQGHTTAAIPMGVIASGTITEDYMQVSCYVANSTNAGSVTMQWAQNSTDGGNATVLKTGSFMIAERVA